MSETYREHMGWQVPLDRARVRPSSLGLDRPWGVTPEERSLDLLVESLVELKIGNGPWVPEDQVLRPGQGKSIAIGLYADGSQAFLGPTDTNVSFKNRERATRSQRDLVSLVVYGALRRRGAIIGTAVAASIMTIVTTVTMLFAPLGTDPFFLMIGWWVAAITVIGMGFWIGHENDRIRRRAGEST